MRESYKEIEERIRELEEKRSKLLLILNEIREKKNYVKEAENPLLSYEPTKEEDCRYGDPQIWFFQSGAKERWILGGNRAGKTDTIITDLAFNITGYYPEYYNKKMRFLDGETRYRPLIFRCYATDYKEGIQNVIWDKLVKKLPTEFRVEPKKQYGNPTEVYFPNGAKLIFGTYQQWSQAPAGTSSHYVLLDEPPDSRRRYEEIIRGTIDTRGRIVIGFTPVRGQGWIEELLNKSTKDLDSYEKLFAIYLDIRDNKYIPKEEVEWWISRLDEEESLIRMKGLSSIRLNRVYSEFDKDEHIIEDFELPFNDYGIPKNWTLYMSLDPHDAQPPAMVWYAVFDPEISGGMSKIFIIREDWTENLTIATMIDRIIEIEKEIGVNAFSRVIDPNYSSRRQIASGYRLIDLIHREATKKGYKINFILGKDSLFQGHNIVRQMLINRIPEGEWKGKPQLQVFRSCSRVIQSFLNYYYKDKQKEKVNDDKYKHWQDNIRYFALSNFRYVNMDEMVRNNIIDVRNSYIVNENYRYDLSERPFKKLYDLILEEKTKEKYEEFLKIRGLDENA
ncbi:MAG: terminase family protein [Candidatus Aenigmatarchaeota archaeon]